jgi:hypothetical protein
VPDGVLADEHFQIVFFFFFILPVRLLLVLWLLVCLDCVLSTVIPSKKEVKTINEGRNGPHKLLEEDRPASLLFTQKFEDLMGSIHATLLLLSPCIQFLLINGCFRHPLIDIFTLDWLLLELIRISKSNKLLAGIGDHTLELLHTNELFFAK